MSSLLHVTASYLAADTTSIPPIFSAPILIKSFNPPSILLSTSTLFLLLYSLHPARMNCHGCNNKYLVLVFFFFLMILESREFNKKVYKADSWFAFFLVCSIPGLQSSHFQLGPHIAKRIKPDQLSCISSRGTNLIYNCVTFLFLKTPLPNTIKIQASKYELWRGTFGS